MDFANDLAWQKIFRGRSTNLKIEKSRFFFNFRYSPPILSHFPIPSKGIKLQLIILILNGRSIDEKNYKLFFFSDFFLPLISSLTRKFSLINQPRERLKLAIVYFDTRSQNGRLAHCECENSARTRFFAFLLHFYKIFRRGCPWAECYQ